MIIRTSLAFVGFTYIRGPGGTQQKARSTQWRWKGGVGVGEYIHTSALRYKQIVQYICTYVVTKNNPKQTKYKGYKTPPDLLNNYSNSTRLDTGPPSATVHGPAGVNMPWLVFVFPFFFFFFKKNAPPTHTPTFSRKFHRFPLPNLDKKN